MMIFVLQAIWLYIKELAGKDLDTEVIVKFLIYVIPTLIPLILPLTILLASIMVFGSFAENYEFAAMKSTGISLQRSMKGLSVFVIFLGLVTFIFANNVIPWANFNFYNLRTNIKKTKPAMAIAEGQFNQIDTYNIKVEKKSGDRGQYFENVTIHEKLKGQRNNARIIRAKSGELASREDSNVLKLILIDGNYYEEITPKAAKNRKKKPFAKSPFDRYTISIDLSETDDVDFENKEHTDKFNMLNMSQLDETIDSLTLKRQTEHESFAKRLLQRSNINRLNSKKRVVKESDTTYTGEILGLFETKAKLQIVDIAISSITSTAQLTTSKLPTLKRDTKNYNKHIISFHQKLALGFACIILFFVGAPLGALIRKGGIGLPMIIAILLFLTYHFIGLFAKNSSENGTLNPVLGAWFSTLIMLPLSVFLTKRATQDKGLFESEGILEPLKKLFGLKKKTLKENFLSYNNKTSEYQELNRYDNNKLIDVIKNYIQYNYSIKYRNTALAIINSRGISNQQLKYGGNFKNQKIEESLRLKNKYEEDSKLAFILYFISAIAIISGRILENNGFPLIGNSLFGLGIVSEIIFIISLVKSFISHSNLNKHIGKESFSNALIFSLVGLPLYFVIYYLQKKKIEEDLNLTSNKILSEKTESEELINIDYSIIGDYLDHSKFALALYSMGMVLLALFFVFKNNKLPSLESASIQLSLVAFFLFVIYYMKLILNLFRFYKRIDETNKRPNLAILIIAPLVYPISHFYLKGKIKEDLRQNCLDSLK